MNDNDRVLDSITAHIKCEQVPEMPSELTANRTVKPRSWALYATAASAIAASVAGYLLWQPQVSPKLDLSRPTVAQHQHTNNPESAVLVLAVDLAEPFEKIESELALIDAEIADLREKAALLDVRRLADSLLAQYSVGSSKDLFN